MKSLTVFRRASFSGVPDALVAPRLDVIVAPITFSPARARSRRTPSLKPAMIASGVVPAERSLIPSSQITAESPDKPSTSLSRRSIAEGPPANGVAGEYDAGPTTRLPPIPALTTATLSPFDAWRRRERTSGHRSSPFNVDAVPSVIESPKQATTAVSSGAMTSTASRKYQDVVVYGNAPSCSSA